MKCSKVFFGAYINQIITMSGQAGMSKPVLFVVECIILCVIYVYCLIYILVKSIQVEWDFRN